MFRTILKASALSAVLIVLGACQAATSNTSKTADATSPVAFQIAVQSDGSDPATVQASFTPGSTADSSLTVTLVATARGSTVTIPVTGAWVGTQGFFQITGAGQVSTTATTWSVSVSGFVASGAVTKVSATLVLGSTGGDGTYVYRATNSTPTTVTSTAFSTAAAGATTSTALASTAVLADFVGAWASDSWTTFASAADVDGTSATFNFRLALAADGTGQLDRDVTFTSNAITAGDVGDITLVSIPTASVGADDPTTLYASQKVVFQYTLYDASGNPTGTTYYGNAKLKKKVSTTGEVSYKVNLNAVGYGTTTDFSTQADAAAATVKVGGTTAVRVPQVTQTDTNGFIVFPKATWTSSTDTVVFSATSATVTPLSGGSAQVYTVVDKKWPTPGIDGKGRPTVTQKFVLKNPAGTYEVRRVRIGYTESASNGFASAYLYLTPFTATDRTTTWDDAATAKSSATVKGTNVTYN